MLWGSLPPYWAHNFIDTSELEELISAFPMASKGLYVTNEVGSAPSAKRHEEQLIPAFLLIKHRKTPGWLGIRRVPILVSVTK